MSRNAIEIDRVSKRYFLGENRGTYDTLRDALSASLRGLIREPEPRQEIWSLRDVSLAVAEGEALGIIGRNGAGKSTLLKVVTRITEPTTGVARTRGRVGALLEVGAGFHLELTGRENVYLNGSILGMKRREIDRHFDEIVEVSGVERFLDTPMKRYSSGMYLRLAVAVAAHLDAKIMVVDEVLAVGDVEFQRKCLGKMSSLEQEGRSVLFVSHHLESIKRLCRTTAWLDAGVVRAYGPSNEVVDEYLAAVLSPVETRSFGAGSDAPVSLQSAHLLDAGGNPSALLERDEPFAIEVQFAVHEPVPNLDCTVFVQTVDGVRVLDEAWSEETPGSERGGVGDYVARIAVPPLLAVGDYVVGVWMGTIYDTLVYDDNVLRFHLEGDSKGRSKRLVQLGLSWDVRPTVEVDRVPAGRGS